MRTHPFIAPTAVCVPPPGSNPVATAAPENASLVPRSGASVIGAEPPLINGPSANGVAAAPAARGEVAGADTRPAAATTTNIATTRASRVTRARVRARPPWTSMSYISLLDRHVGALAEEGKLRKPGRWAAAHGRPAEGESMPKLMHETRRLEWAGAVDADGHILEPPDLWETYLEPQYRDRALRLVSDENGLEALEIGGRPSVMSRRGFPSTLGAMGDPDLGAIQRDPGRTYVREAP